MTWNFANSERFTILDSTGGARKEAQNGTFPPQPQPQACPLGEVGRVVVTKYIIDIIDL